MAEDPLNRAPADAMSKYLRGRYLPSLAREAGAGAIARSRLVDSAISGLYSGEAMLAHSIANAIQTAGEVARSQAFIDTMEMRARTGLEMPGLEPGAEPFKPQSDMFRRYYAGQQQQAINKMPPDPSLLETITAGATATPAMIGEVVPVAAAIGPWALPALIANRASRDPMTGEFQGVGATAMGALEGYAMHSIGVGAAKAENPFTRFVLGGTGFASIAGFHGARGQELVSNFFLGGSLTVLGSPSRRTGREGTGELTPVERELAELDMARTLMSVEIDRAETPAEATRIRSLRSDVDRRASLMRNPRLTEPELAEIERLAQLSYDLDGRARTVSGERETADVVGRLNEVNERAWQLIDQGGAAEPTVALPERPRSNAELLRADITNEDALVESLNRELTEAGTGTAGRGDIEAARSEAIRNRESLVRRLEESEELAHDEQRANSAAREPSEYELEMERARERERLEPDEELDSPDIMRSGDLQAVARRDSMGAETDHLVGADAAPPTLHPESGVPRFGIDPPQFPLPGGRPEGRAPQVAIPGERVTAWQADMNRHAVHGDYEGLHAGNINLERMLPEGALEIPRVMEMMSQYGEGASGYWQARRRRSDGSVRTNEETILGARERARLMLGEEPDATVARANERRQFLDEELAAIEIVMQARMATLADAHQGLTRDLPGAEATYADALTRLVASSYEASGRISEAGRALNMLRGVNSRLKRGVAADLLVDKYGGSRTMREVAELVSGLESPAEVMSVLRETHDMANRSLGWRAVDFWLAGLLSSPATHRANIQSNTIFSILFHGLEEPVAVAYGLAEQGIRIAVGAKPTDRVYAQEVAIQLWALAEATPFAMEAVGKALRTGKEFSVDGIRSNSAYDVARGQQRGLSPFTLLTAADAVSKAQAYYARMSALGMREAIETGVPIAQRKAHVNKFMNESSNPPRPAGPDGEYTSAQRKRMNTMRGHKIDAMRRAEEMTFTNALGTIGKHAIRLTNSHPLAKIPVAFLRTPVNVSKQGIYRTPGLAFAAPKTWSDLIAGGQRRHRAMARMTVAFGLGLYMMDKMYAGEITGASPMDPAESETQRSKRIPPFSRPPIPMFDKLPFFEETSPDGEAVQRMISYSKDEPLATPFAVMSTFADWHRRGVLDDRTVTEYIDLVAIALAENIMSKSALQGAAKLGGALSDPRRGLTPYVERMAGSIVPSGVNYLARIGDPMQRNQQGLAQAFWSRIPGIREKMPQMYDRVGRPYFTGAPWDSTLRRASGEYSMILMPHDVLDMMSLTGADIQRMAPNITVTKGDIIRAGDPEDKDEVARLYQDFLGLYQPKISIDMTPAQREEADGAASKAAADWLMNFIPAYRKEIDALEGGPAREMTIPEMRRAGVDPELLNAYEKTDMKKANIYRIVHDLIVKTYQKEKGKERSKVIKAWFKRGQLRDEIEKALARQRSEQEALHRSYGSMRQ